jgi:ATP-dependent helicase HrpA
VQELEHKARRQDVLVDDDLIHAFYDQQIPADVASASTFERWMRQTLPQQPKLLMLSRDELMRHEAAGITTATFPKTIRLGGVDCAASYLHEPGDAKDGLTVALPIYALNPASEERCEWLVPGMLAAKVTALLRSLPQKPRARLLPLPAFVDHFIAHTRFGEGSLIDAVLLAVRERSQLPVQRNDFKVETLPTHLLMNFRVVDEHGRQLGVGRHLAALKAELGGQARSAFAALAALKSAQVPATAGAEQPVASSSPSAAREVRQPVEEPAPPKRHTTWDFGELPELMEIPAGRQTLVGFPALVDKLSHVEIEVFDEPDIAAARHRIGMRRLVMLAIKAPLEYLAKNIVDLRTMAVAYMALGSAEALRDQIIDVAIDRAFLIDPLPHDAASFATRIEQGRPRLNLVAQEVARSAATVLLAFGAAQRKLKDSRPPKDVADDIGAQLQRLVPPRFLVLTPHEQIKHLPRYLEAIVLRLDKLRTDPARDAARMAELRPLEQRWLRRLPDLKGATDARLDDYRWLLEELRVSLFAQELRTPMPVSAKRLDKAWAQLMG